MGVRVVDNLNLLVGLDIGTTGVKAVVADSGEIIGAVDTANKGMRHGKIVDIDQTASAIKTALTDVAQKTNAKIYRVVTAIPVGMLQLETAGGLINIGEDGREVTNKDVRRVLSTAIKAAVKSGRKAISFLPSRFLLDGKTDVDDPRKMIAHSLEVKGVLLTAPVNSLHNINKAIERAGYQNNFFVPAPLAIANVALDEGERTFGSIVLDMGGGATTATVIHDGMIKYATIDAEGGQDITNDISVVLSTSKADANQLKLDYGYADPELASDKDQFAVKSVGQSQQQMVDEHYLSEIINARLEQISSRLGKGLASHEALNLPGGVVISGGSSNLQGIEKLIANDWGIKTRIYQPDQIGMRDPKFAVAFGVVQYAYQLTDIDFLVNSVIYGNGALADNDDLSDEKIEKNLQRNSEDAESSRKESYNRHKLPHRVDEHANQEKKTRKEKKSIGDFFKKFFD